MMEDTIVKAPWTQEQVDRLNGWQQCTWLHPFTCNGEGDCQEKYSVAGRELIATTEGWVCQCGQYKQEWAHSYMASGELPPDWREEIKRKAEEQGKQREP